MRSLCPRRFAPGTPALARSISALLLAAFAGCGGGDGGGNRTEPPVRPDLAAHAGSTSAAGRPAVLAAAERAITADARARVRRHEIRGPIRRTSCDERGGPGEGHQEVVVYSCLAIAFETPGSATAPPLASGQPFQVRVDYPRRRFAWCKIEPPGGEGAGRPGREHAPPDACGGIG